MMTRKHFEAIASILNKAYRFYRQYEPNKEITEAIIKDIANELARFFWRENQNFDVDKFLNACFKEN